MATGSRGASCSSSGDAHWKTVIVPPAAENLTGLEALTTGITFVWFGDAKDTIALVGALQTSAGTTRWESCAHYVRNYRGGQTPAPDSLSVRQQAEAEELGCTISDALDVFRRLVASYNERGPTDTGLFYAYLLWDPACWGDWVESARGVVDRAPRSG